uniref:(California timema) hypothetical protein n=1 Tax=Timema californicum TaxID=61474 RepID=A0A7R9JFQ1_TIMCA|nr:unnamed protein product [Timema californicum]
MTVCVDVLSSNMNIPEAKVVLFVGFVLIAVTGALARSARSARSSSGFYTAHQDSGFAKLEDISSKGNQFVERHSRNGRYDSSVPQLEEQKIPVHVVYYYPEEVISHNIGQAVQNTTVASISNLSWHDQPKEDAHSSTEQREDLNTTGQENVTTHGISSFNSTQNINISVPENPTNFTNENINKEQSVQEHLQTSNRTTHSKSIKFGSDIASTRNTIQNVPLDSRSTGLITKPLESIGNMALPQQDQRNENGEISFVPNGEKPVTTFNNDNLGYSAAITSFNDSKLNPTAAGNDSLSSRAEAMNINTNSPYRFSSASMLSHGFVNPSFIGIPGNQQPSDQRDLMMSSRISWPFADYFPIVINDPLLAMFSAFTNMVEYGPAADVCRKLDGTSSRQSKQMREFDEVSQSDRRGRGGVITFEKSRPSWTFLGNARDNSGNVRTIPEIETEVDSIKDLDTISASSNKSTLETEEDIEELRKNKDDETEIVMSSGNRKGAGPFITRLVVRRGGVSIAGPGGVATAGSGGTAIVGPGGVAYTSPNGLAVVGPGGKVVSLPSGLDVVFTQDNSTSNDFDGSQPRVAKIPPGGRLLATGPIVYYHQPE